MGCFRRYTLVLVDSGKNQLVYSEIEIDTIRLLEVDGIPAA